MTTLIREVDEFKIFELKGDKLRNKYVLRNSKGNYHAHSHLESEEACLDVIDYIKRGEVPRNGYLRESCRKLSLDNKYLREIERMNYRVRNKQKYINRPAVLR